MFVVRRHIIFFIACYKRSKKLIEFAKDFRLNRQRRTIAPSYKVKTVLPKNRSLLDSA